MNTGTIAPLKYTLVIVINFATTCTIIASSHSSTHPALNDSTPPSPTPSPLVTSSPAPPHGDVITSTTPPSLLLSPAPAHCQQYYHISVKQAICTTSPTFQAIHHLTWQHTTASIRHRVTVTGIITSSPSWLVLQPIPVHCHNTTTSQSNTPSATQQPLSIPQITHQLTWEHTALSHETAGTLLGFAPTTSPPHISPNMPCSPQLPPHQVKIILPGSTQPPRSTSTPT